jgi:hypothetical protein
VDAIADGDDVWIAVTAAAYPDEAGRVRVARRDLSSLGPWRELFAHGLYAIASGFGHRGAIGRDATLGQCGFAGRAHCGHVHP